MHWYKLTVHIKIKGYIPTYKLWVSMAAKSPWLQIVSMVTDTFLLDVSFVLLHCLHFSLGTPYLEHRRCGISVTVPCMRCGHWLRYSTGEGRYLGRLFYGRMGLSCWLAEPDVYQLVGVGEVCLGVLGCWESGKQFLLDPRSTTAIPLLAQWRCPSDKIVALKCQGS